SPAAGGRTLAPRQTAGSSVNLRGRTVAFGVPPSFPHRHAAHSLRPPFDHGHSLAGSTSRAVGSFTRILTPPNGPEWARAGGECVQGEEYLAHDCPHQQGRVRRVVLLVHISQPLGRNSSDPPGESGLARVQERGADKEEDKDQYPKAD